MRQRSALASQIPISGIRAMRDLTRSLEGVIHLEVGEPDFPTPPEVIDAAFAAARAGATRYTPAAGTESLRNAIATWSVQHGRRRVTPDQIIVTSGASATIAVTLLAIAERGDEVLIPDPGWASYAGHVYVAGGTAVRYPQPRELGFLPDVPAIRDLITPRTKAIVVNDPGNPGGGVFPRELVREIVELAAEHDLYLVSDEIYEDFPFDTEHVPADVFDRDGRVITISGFSKTFSMTGWRLGYAIAAPAVAADVARVAGAVLSCPSSVSQAAGEQALRMSPAEIDAMRASYRRRRDLVVSILEPAGLLPVRPQGAFYALVDLSRLGDDMNEVALRLLREERVATTPGDAFGPRGRGHVRISFATAEPELAEGLHRIVAFAGRSGADLQPARVGATAGIAGR